MISALTPLAGASLLHVAADYGHAAVAHLLIERGADVNA
jgi:ankyrin repeat protein